MALFELDRWVRVSLSGEGALSVVLVEVFVEARERELALFGCLAGWIGCSCFGIPVPCVKQACDGESGWELFDADKC